MAFAQPEMVTVQSAAESWCRTRMCGSRTAASARPVGSSCGGTTQP